MLADETTEQDMHGGVPWLVVAVEADENSVKEGGEATFTLTAGEKRQTLKGNMKEMATVGPGTKIMMQATPGASPASPGPTVSRRPAPRRGVPRPHALD